MGGVAGDEKGQSAGGRALKTNELQGGTSRWKFRCLKTRAGSQESRFSPWDWVWEERGESFQEEERWGEIACDKIGRGTVQDLANGA